MPISLSGSLNLSGSLTTTGTITATTLVVQTITSSISSITGSTNFGSLVTDTHQFTGSLNVSGSGTFVGNISASALTLNSLTADYASTITNVQDSSQGLLVRASDNDTGLYVLNLQSSVGATSQTWVSRLVVDKAGSVGIGTTSPNTWATNLVVYNNQLTITGGGYDGSFADSIFFGGNSEGTNYRNKISNSLSSNPVNQKMRFSVASGSTTFSDVMTLVGNGNVGIGTSTPSRKLIIQGGTSNAGLEILSTNGYRSAIIAGRGSSGTASDQGYFQMTDQGTATVVLDTAGNSYVNGGNFGIGTNAPARKFVVQDTSADPFISIMGAYPNQGGILFGDTTYTDSSCAIRFDRTNNALWFSTSGASSERMRISSAGYVTAPYQPSFYIVSNGGQTDYTTNEVIIFNTARHNIGSCYNTSTGRFTAPVAGRYLFTLNVYAYPNYTAAILLTINGAQYAGGGDVTPYVYTSSSADAKTISFTLVWELSASDYVEVRARSTTRIYRAHSHFSGQLLS